MCLKIEHLLGVYVGFRVVTLSAASDAPNITKAYSGMLGRITATTSSLCAPRLTRPWPKDLDKAWASDMVYLSSLTASTCRHCIWLDSCHCNRNSQLTRAALSPHLPSRLQHISWKLRFGSCRSITSLSTILVCRMLQEDSFLVSPHDLFRFPPPNSFIVWFKVLIVFSHWKRFYIIICMIVKRWVLSNAINFRSCH